MNEPAQRCEEQIISLFQDRETLHTNYHLSSILTDNGYGLKECGVVGEWNITEEAGNLCVDKRLQGSLFLKNGTGGENTEYVMADADTVIGIKRQELLFLPVVLEYK